MGSLARGEQVQAAGLYVDDEVGAATCTGLGEAVLRTLASFLAVERMRAGDSPQQACEHANYKSFQVGILAINKAGQHGAYAIHKGSTYARNTEMFTAASYD